MKYIDADKLKAEIEKRLKNTRDYMSGTGMKYKGPKYFKAQGKESAYDALLNVLDSLQQEQPEEPDKSLEEEVKNYFQGYWPGTETAEQCNTDMHFTPPAILRLAHHFAKWGAEHAKKDETPVPNDLEEAAIDFADNARKELFTKDYAISSIADYDHGCIDGFIAGAKWQAEQFEKNRLAHCDALSEEDCDRETDFAMEIIEKEHRHPTFIDAINYGMRLRAEKDKDTIELAEEHAYFAGAVNEREQMMKGAVEFECIGKKVKMTVEELINYYIDTECCEVADECGF